MTIGSSSVYCLYKLFILCLGEQVFRIEIADKNDHPPRFTQSVYEAEEIPEDANLNALVTEVKALDNDTASPVSYTITDGNVYNAFLIENTTGKIKVNSKLDYESITNVSIDLTSHCSSEYILYLTHLKSTVYVDSKSI